jgi:transcription antitermination factor NusG
MPRASSPKKSTKPKTPAKPRAPRTLPAGSPGKPDSLLRTDEPAGEAGTVAPEAAAEAAVCTLEKGDRVRVLSGPFGNSRGHVDACAGVMVRVRINGRTLIEEPSDNLEAVGP